MKASTSADAIASGATRNRSVWRTPRRNTKLSSTAINIPTTSELLTSGWNWAGTFAK